MFIAPTHTWPYRPAYSGMPYTSKYSRIKTVAYSLREAPNHVNLDLTTGLVAGETLLESAATKRTPEFVVDSIIVVLVDCYPQPPARQRPVAQALDNIGRPVAAEYAFRPAGLRGLAGTHFLLAY